MAGVVDGGGSKAGRRSLDAEINLVPFIDLLSMCICFLLMTAVWMQVGAIQVKQSHGTEGAAPGGYELDVRFSGPTSLDVFLKKNGKAVKQAKLKAEAGGEVFKALDASITDWLAALNPGVPTGQAGSIVSTGMVTPMKGVSYGDLVSAMDVLRRHQIVNLGVVPNGG